MLKHAKTVQPGERQRFTILDYRDRPSSVIHVKKMAHKFKPKEPATYGLLSSIHTGGKPIINTHSIDNVFPAAIKRSIGHVNEENGFLEDLQPYAATRLNESRNLNFIHKIYAYCSSLVLVSDLILPWTRSQYIDECPAHKRKLYKSKRERLERRGLSTKDFTVRARIKAEKKPYKNGFTPRLFFPYDTGVNIELGRYLKPIEHHTYSSIDRYYEETYGTTSRTVMKGLNAVDKGSRIREKWEKFHNPIAIELDCTHFDKHVNRRLLRLEHSYYSMFYPGDSYLAWLLRKQLTSKCDVTTNDGYRVSWKTQGGRMSGCVNTALGNIFLVCMVFNSYAAELQRRNITFEYVNEGDDCFFIIERKHLRSIPNVYDHFTQFGLKVRVENEVTIFNKLRFCQTAPINVNGQWRMIRDPRTVFFKDTVQLYWKSNDNMQKWLHEVGTAGLTLNAGVPILQDLYLMYIRLGTREGKLTQHQLVDISNSGLFNLVKGLGHSSGTGDNIADTTRVEFYQLSGIHPDIQMTVENELKRYTKLDFGDAAKVKTFFHDFVNVFQALLK
jgi:hypothetical protein